MKKRFIILSLILIILTVFFSLSACRDGETSAPQTYESALSKMESLGYQVTEIPQEYLTGGAINGFSAYNSEKQSGIMAYWFETEEIASSYLNGWNDDRYDVKESDGVCAYYGTQKAVEDFIS